MDMVPTARSAEGCALSENISGSKHSAVVTGQIGKSSSSLESPTRKRGESQNETSVRPMILKFAMGSAKVPRVRLLLRSVY